MNKRGSRGKTSTVKNRKMNFKKLGSQTVGVIFGIPQFAATLVAHEISRVEGIVQYAIKGGSIENHAAKRRQVSADMIITMEDTIQNGVDKVKSTFTKKQADVESV